MNHTTDAPGYHGIGARAPAATQEEEAMTAGNGIEARAAARGAAAATGANPALRSVMLNLCARHGARRILWMGRGHEPLGLSLQQAGYAVWGMDPGGLRATARAEGDPASPPGETGRDPDLPRGEPGRFDLAISTESPEPCAALDARVALAADRLRPGGHFLLSIPYQDSLKSRIAALCDRWRPRRSRSRGPSWSTPRVKRLLESHGFVLAELIGVRDASLQLKTVVWVARQDG
jgi:SAM-dependent methyltransferase